MVYISYMDISITKIFFLLCRLKRVHIKTIVLWNLCCVVSIYVDYAQNSGTWFDFILSPMSIFKEQMSEPKYEGFAKNISSSFLCRNLTSILEIICSYFTLMFCMGCIYDLRKVQLCRKLLFTTPEKGSVACVCLIKWIK